MRRTNYDSRSDQCRPICAEFNERLTSEMLWIEIWPEALQQVTEIFIYFHVLV